MDEAPADIGFDERIAARLRMLRAERRWSLDELARRCDVSRATLSRLENAEVSPTASVLGRLCAAYRLPMSRLMRLVEDDYTPLMRHPAQTTWTDRTNGFRRRSVSPPAARLAGEVIECELPPGTRIVYERAPSPGLEHHLVLLEGELEVTLEQQVHHLCTGDCLRYQLVGSSAFETAASTARYFLFIV